MKKFPQCLVWLALVLAAGYSDASAQSPQAQAAESRGKPSADVQAIEQTMKKTFDKPGSPLRIPVVAVEGRYALASWLQQNRGGRALLKMNSGQWSIEVCAGDGLTDVSALSTAGLSTDEAQRLASKLRMLEARLPPAQVKQFSTFEGVVHVGDDRHKTHGPHMTGQN